MCVHVSRNRAIVCLSQGDFRPSSEDSVVDFAVAEGDSTKARKMWKALSNYRWVRVLRFDQCSVVYILT